VIERHDEMIEESASAENRRNRETVGESGFDANDIPFDMERNFVEVSVTAWSCDDSAQRRFLTVLYPDTDRSSDVCVEVAVRGTGVYECIEAVSGWRVASWIA